MMENTSILYHPESIAEMQLIITCIIGYYGLLNYQMPDHFAEFAENVE